MIKPIRLLLFAGLIGLYSATTAYSAQVNFTFSGAVTSIDNPYSYLASIGITESSTFTGSFTYNTDAKPHVDSEPNSAFYPIDTLLNITFNNSIVIFNRANSLYGSLAYVVNDGVEPTNYPGIDSFTTDSTQLQSTDSGLNNLFTSALHDSFSAFRLVDYQGNVWEDTNLPNSFDLTKFDTAEIIVSLRDNSPNLFNDDFTLRGRVTQISSSAVPLPSSAILLFFGVSGLLRYRSKKN